MLSLVQSSRVERSLGGNQVGIACNQVSAFVPAQLPDPACNHSACNPSQTAAVVWAGGIARGFRTPWVQDPVGSGSRGFRTPWVQDPVGSGSRGFRIPWVQDAVGSGSRGFRILAD